MDADARSQCSWCSLGKELPVCEVDVELQVCTFSTSSIAMKRELPKIDHLTLSTCCSHPNVDHLRLVLHKLPLVQVKRIVQGYLALRSAIEGEGADTKVAVVATTRPHPDLQLRINSSLTKEERCIVAKFVVSDVDTGDDDSYSLMLTMCARCGCSSGCGCGWRALPMLPPFVTRQISSYSFALGKIDVTSFTGFDVKIYANEVLQPMVERPYVVFKMQVCLGELTWHVAKRYREFVELHNRLTALFPENYLPSFPTAKWLAPIRPSFSPQRRQYQLQTYLQGVLMIDEAQDSVPLLSFLGALSTIYIDHIVMRGIPRHVLHLQVLEFYTKPGDLILFNGRANASLLQRLMTRSEWDHVAIVVPPREGTGLQLLEATGDGVTLFPLIGRLLAYASYHVQYVALRKLHTPLLSRAVVDDILDRFTSEVNGLAYGLSVLRILHASQADPSRSRFFCSELVAEAYKALGIISSSSMSTDFWPGSFTPGDFVDVQLARHGAELSHEIIVDCKLLEVATATRKQNSWT